MLHTEISYEAKSYYIILYVCSDPLRLLSKDCNASSFARKSIDRDSLSVTFARTDRIIRKIGIIKSILCMFKPPWNVCVYPIYVIKFVGMPYELCKRTFRSCIVQYFVSACWCFETKPFWSSKWCWNLILVLVACLKFYILYYNYVRGRLFFIRCLISLELSDLLMKSFRNCCVWMIFSTSVK